MSMPDLNPAARALAHEYVRHRGRLAEPVVEEIRSCLIDVCRRHFQVRNLREDRIEGHALEMAYRLIHDCQGRREGGSVIPFPAPGVT
jgi:hypothetical protein